MSYIAHQWHFFVAALACWLVIATSGYEKNSEDSRRVVIQVDTSSVLISDFKGFGAEWDPYFWADYNIAEGITEQDWQNDIKRMERMRIPFVRMMMQLSWVMPKLGEPNWDAPQMKSLYRHLDACQEENITVFLTDWGLNTTWNKVLGVKGDDDPNYAKAIGTYLNYLIKNRGYTCIKYFIFVNEPNIYPGKWDVWKKGLSNVAEVIKKENIPVRLVGSDESGDIDWQIMATQQLHSLFAVWEIHTYLWQSLIISGSYQDTLVKYWSLVKASDTRPDEKFFMIGEMSPSDGMRGSSRNDSAGTYGYAINIADMGVQAVLAGTSAVSAWMLEDAEHKGFNMGMWKDKAHGFRYRPWFYTWSLLSGYFPPGSRIFSTTSKFDSLRCLVAESPNGNWSICLINRRRAEAMVEVSASFMTAPMRFNYYIYSTERLATDEQGFLMPIKKVLIHPTENYSVVVPPNSMIVLTTMK